MSSQIFCRGIICSFVKDQIRDGDVSGWSRTGLSILAVLFTCHFGTAQEADGRRVLFVGNSYTYFWNLPQQVCAMAEASDLNLFARQSTSGGARLSHHWRGERDLETRQIIAEGDYDAIVFQGHSMSTIEFRDSLIYYANALCADIPSDDIQRYVYMTWPRNWNPIMHDSIVAGYEMLASTINATVVPVGPAWKLSRELRPDLGLYDEDGSHPSALGTYLTACVFYGVLTGRSPVGLPNRLITTDKDGEKLYLNIQSEENAEFCQRVADRALGEYFKN